MLGTFPSLEFGLMVGIGGGVPSKGTDIRLGDVVVSIPTATSGGIIQYDYGKSLRHGRFQRTGSLNKPPQFLLTAVSQLRSDSLRGERAAAETLSNILEKHQEIRENFSRPDKDWLFKSEYYHQGSNDNIDCSTCDQTQLVNRVPRLTDDPYIHYGLIASGNQVMKDAKSRDSIARDMDTSILCFEMEAAGIVDQLPCLVIRGICDYCDSHKHKQWQGYAALSAAAYARSLLGVVPVHQRDGGRKKEEITVRHWTVPFRRNNQFVGRQNEIDELEELISTPDGPQELAISGLGGVGKTQIALELAYRIRDRDAEYSIFWVPCISRASVEQAYISIAQEIGLQGVDPAEVKNQVNAYLNQKSARKWLLIFDNADDVDMWVNGASALKDSLPENENGRILFTSRNHRLAVDLASPHVISITELDEDTGWAFLQKSLIQKDLLNNRDIYVSLLEHLAFLPLAISQAVAFINRNGISLEDYIMLLKEQEPELIELLSDDFQDKWRYNDIQNPIATTWWISFQQIQNTNNLAADYLSFMACINPRDIPLSILPEAASKRTMIDALGLLKSYSFITEQTRNRSLSLHRLVHLATRNWMRKNQRLSMQVLKAADRLNQVFPDNEDVNRTLWRELLPHALVLIQESEFQWGQAKYVDLVDKIGCCLFSDGRYNEGAVILEKSVQAQNENSGTTSLAILESKVNLALIYCSQGRLKDAENLQRQALDICSKTLGLESHHTLRVMNDLAMTYHAQGKWKEAENLLIQVTETDMQAREPRFAFRYMNNLALIYQSLEKWKESEDLLVQVVETEKEVLGPEHPDTLTSMSNLTSTYRSQEKWEEAQDLQGYVLGLQKRILGPEHPSTLLSMQNLAATYWPQGKLKEAEDLLLNVIEVFGPEHPHTLIVMLFLSEILKDQEENQSSLNFLEDCVELHNRVLGPEHSNSRDATSALNHWKEKHSLPKTHPQEPAAKSPAAVVIPDPPDEKHTTSRPSHKGLTARYELILRNHPLIIASRRASSVDLDLDLEEVD
ncbi:putative kinesin light chain [Talaromyces proteolyticus]|uniref:Kinesin light chain n=1 Tax=Talaromyces proteolyticus TaxID=1131652 RepID=A0AAD4L3L6_9EURO|nr:putative kinesin light chain [Talaromyces proteolyticus]KAH8703588.1 putative kinesin light chain [Talaromyces proteolyticus]